MLNTQYRIVYQSVSPSGV